MNLHIVSDEKFINGAIQQFEKHDPNQNIFIVNSVSPKLKYVEVRKEVSLLRLSDAKDIKKLNNIIETYTVNKVFVHALSPLKAAVSNALKKKYGLKTYWIFYGADLYNLLEKDFGYTLYDFEFKKNASLRNSLAATASFLKFCFYKRSTPRNSIMEFIKNLDYFCFWNNYDFELLKKYYPTKAAYLNFAYYDAIDRDLKDIRIKHRGTILINNSASRYGNHATILNKIKGVEGHEDLSKIISPLSYGNTKISKSTVALGTQLFGNKFNPLLHFLDKKSYFSLLDEVSVAFFGSRRQEAAGNIFQLLANGVKIFLRNDNNMRLFLKDKGFIVFSFEDEFNSIEDLNPLAMNQMIQNRNAFFKLFNDNEEDLAMTKIINS